MGGLRVAVGVLAVSLTAVVANGQTPTASGQAPTAADARPRSNTAASIISTVQGNSRMTSGFTPEVRCAATSEDPTNYWTGQGLTIRFSFGVVPAVDRLGSMTQYIGSWMVRNIVGADATHPESVAAYFFDGRFTGGSVTPVKGGGMSYDLRGVTTGTTSSCRRHNTGSDTVSRGVRIYGRCGTGQDIFFRVTDAGRDWAAGTFRGDVTCASGAVSSVNVSLNRR